MIDGKRSVEDIAKEANMDPTFVINILDFMSKEGIIQQFDKDAALANLSSRKSQKPVFTTQAKLLMESKTGISQTSTIL